MGAYQDWLVDYINTHPKFIQPDFRRNETLGFLRKKLNDLCISRPKSRMAWGIELPFDPDYVCYVWFDALVHYVSAAGYLADNARFARWWPASCHLIGKDILTTHTVYWPTMLKAMNVPMPETVFAHGWWLVGESKMSKSLNNDIELAATPKDTLKKIKGAYTDPNRKRREDPGNPDICNIWKLHGFFKADTKTIAAECREARRGCVDCKVQLAESVNEALKPFREKREQLAADLDYVVKVYNDGADRARAIAVETLREVKERMGLL